MNKYLITLTVIVIILVGAYYLLFTNPEAQPTPTPTSTPESIKLGLMIPLSGDNASLGESTLAGAQLAVKEINDAGGINGRLMEVAFEDDQCTKDGGIAAMTKLVVINQVTAILGSLCSEASASSNSIAQVAGVPVVMIGVSATDLTKVGDFIFSVYPTEHAQAVAMAEYLKQNLKKEKVVVVYTDNENGKNFNQAFDAKFKELGGKVVYNNVVAKDNVSKIKTAKADIVFLPVTPSVALSIIQQIKDVKLKTPVVGIWSWDTDLLITAKEADGYSYFVPRTNNFEEFKNNLKSVVGKDATIYSAYVYDAIKILAETMKQTGTDKKSLRTALVSVFYDKSISSPIIEFNDNRELKSFLVSLKTIKDGKAELVSEEQSAANASSTTATSSAQ